MRRLASEAQEVLPSRGPPSSTSSCSSPTEYITCNAQAAFTFLQQHSDVPHDLSFDSSDLAMLKSLLAGLSLPSRDAELTKAPTRRVKTRTRLAPWPWLASPFSPRRPQLKWPVT